MTGLAFPSDVPFDCETSHEYYGTHLNNDNNIPIDPALGGPVIDPALIGEGESEAKYDVSIVCYWAYFRGFKTRRVPQFLRATGC